MSVESENNLYWCVLYRAATHRPDLSCLWNQKTICIGVCCTGQRLTDLTCGVCGIRKQSVLVCTGRWLTESENNLYWCVLYRAAAHRPDLWCLWNQKKICIVVYRAVAHRIRKQSVFLCTGQRLTDLTCGVCGIRKQSVLLCTGRWLTKSENNLYFCVQGSGSQT